MLSSSSKLPHTRHSVDGQVQWSNLCGGWRGKLVSSIACLAPVFSCRIVLMKEMQYSTCAQWTMLRIVISWNLPHSLNPSTSSIEQHTLTRCARVWRGGKPAGAWPPRLSRWQCMSYLKAETRDARGRQQRIGYRIALAGPSRFASVEFTRCGPLFLSRSIQVRGVLLAAYI